MAKKKKEEVIENAPEKPIVDDKVEKIQIKKKPKKFTPEPDVIKVDLSNDKKEAKEDIVKVDLSNDKKEEVIEVVEETPVVQTDTENTEQQDIPVLEEITSEETTQEASEIAEVAEQAIVESIETGKELPENIQKLVDFMDETGGDLNDYVNLNKNYEDLDNDQLLREYYKQTKPHLSADEIEFIMEDNFSYDADVDEDKEIRRKKLALKEQVASAKSHLDGLKSKYYEDIKAGSKLTQEQQEAINFFNRYNEESEQSNKFMQEQANTFVKKTDQVFNEKFKGFEYKVGDKRFRFNVKDPKTVKENQSDINNFIKKFLNKENLMEDAGGYHKSLFTAMNPDQIANHFYEQGRADALKESIAKSKNVSMEPRKSHIDNVNTSGLRVRALDDDGPDFKFQIKNKNNKFKN